jgi:hypothetical protein
MITMDPRAKFAHRWPDAIRGKLLTDAKIVRYAAQGYYSAEFRENRKRFAEMKKAKREGNFIRMPDGRLIYSPE